MGDREKSALQFLDAMHVRVTFGQVTADVGERGKGFIVDTAQTQVVDLGTKFGVAVRVDGQQQLSRIVNVTSGPREEGWSTSGNAPGAVIASVRDNRRDPSELYYYRILAGGMREDAPAFVAKRHKWNGLDASGLPTELIGADLVQTFPGDRDNSGLEIIVTVARPAVVYVLADSRTAPPPWLEETFTTTGLLIGLENAPLLTSGRSVGRGPGEGNMAPFAV